MIRSNKLRQSARGEACTLQILGVCNHNPETTVLAHLPSEQHGMALKADDTCSCFACSACHDCIDRRRIVPEFEERRHWYLLRAIQRTTARWFERGIVRVA
jgi:hypothetical protein